MEAPANPDTIEILITLPFAEDLIAPLRELSPRLSFTIQPARRPEDIPAEVWAKTEVLYTDRLLPSPEQAPNLRWLQFHSAGIDFAVDSPILQKPGLAATTLSGAAAPQAAEYCLSVLLAMAHHIPELLAAQAKSEWPHDRWENFIPKELRGSTIGIVGFGSIGRELARLVAPFGTIVLAAKHDAMRPVDVGYTVEGLGDPEGNLFTRLYPYQAVGSMVKQCDFVVVAVPLTPVTRGMYNAQVIAAMKPGSYLVVVGRGGVVDEAALLSALQEKRLAGAALDVFSEEPLSPTNPLWRAPGIVITPHIAGISTQYDRRAMDLFAANLKRYLGNSPLYNLYNPQKGY